MIEIIDAGHLARSTLGEVQEEASCMCVCACLCAGNSGRTNDAKSLDFLQLEELLFVD